MLMYFLDLVKGAKSKSGHFYKPNGTESMVHMVTTIGNYLFTKLKFLDATAVWLSLDEQGVYFLNMLLRLGLLLLLPGQRRGLPELMMKLLANDDAYQQLLLKSQYVGENVCEQLPAFTISISSVGLKESFIKMGMATAFDSYNASYEDPTEKQEYSVTEMFQRASIKIRYCDIQLTSHLGAWA